MEEYVGRGATQGPSVEQNMTTMLKVGVCGCHEISTIMVSRMDSLQRKVYGAVWNCVKWGQKPARTQGDLSAVRSSERNERSSVLASEMGELVLKGLVNWDTALEGETMM